MHRTSCYLIYLIKNSAQALNGLCLSERSFLGVHFVILLTDLVADGLCFLDLGRRHSPLRKTKHSCGDSSKY